MNNERHEVVSVRDIDEMLACMERFIDTRLSVEDGLVVVRRVRARSDSWMCRLAERQAADRPEEDAVEVVRQKTGVSKRDAKQVVDVSHGLRDLPGVKRKLAEGEITFDHAKALSDVASKVGPEMVESDGELLKQAVKEPVDVFSRRARRWVNRQLAKAGVDPLERQRRARAVKMWTDRETGLGVLLAKFPADRFQHLRQAADALYLREYRRDKEAGDGDPNRIRNPQQRMADRDASPDRGGMPELPEVSAADQPRPRHRKVVVPTER